MKTFYKEGVLNLENKNILVNKENRSIELQPYTDELTLETIPALLQLVLSEFDDSYSVDLSCDHSFNGLRETNVYMLKQGGEITNNYDSCSVLF